VERTVVQLTPGEFKLQKTLLAVIQQKRTGRTLVQMDFLILDAVERPPCSKCIDRRLSGVSYTHAYAYAYAKRFYNEFHYTG
jgi:hypothetical protein